MWAHYGADLQVGTFEDFERLAGIARETQSALKAATWDELFDALGEDVTRNEFSTWIDDAWDEWCSEHNVDGDAMPDDWFPEDLPDLSGDWLSDRPRYNDPEQLELPEQFMELGKFQTTMLGGDFVSWAESDLPMIKRLALRLRYDLVERPDLIVWV